MFLKACVIFLFLTISGLYGREIRIRNMYYDSIYLTGINNKNGANLEGVLVEAGKPALIEVEDDFNGRFLANLPECQNKTCDNPATLVEFGFGIFDYDYYDVSLVDGFNMVVKVVPIGDVANCNAVSCQADLIKLCPTENKVQNDENVDVACKSTPELFGKYCPAAFVTPTDPDKENKCLSESVRLFEITFG